MKDTHVADKEGPRKTVAPGEDLWNVVGSRQSTADRMDGGMRGGFRRVEVRWGWGVEKAPRGVMGRGRPGRIGLDWVGWCKGEVDDTATWLGRRNGRNGEGAYVGTLSFAYTARSDASSKHRVVSQEGVCSS